MMSTDDPLISIESNNSNQENLPNNNENVNCIENPTREFEILETNKCKAQIAIGNFLFVKNKEGSKKGKNFVYWVCKENRTAAKCKSRCITDNKLVKLIKPPSEHSHEPFNEEKMSKIKKAIVDPTDPTKICFSNSSKKFRKKKLPFELLNTAKSAVQLKIGNFIFQKDKNCKDITYWVCKENRKHQCKSRCSTTTDLTDLIKKPTEHNHVAYTKEELQKIQNVSNRVKISKDASKKIKLKYLKTMKLETQINLNNFIYQKNKVIDGVTYWSCKLSKKCKCRSTLRTKGSLEGDATNLMLLNEPKEHNHIPYSDEQIENMKNVAKTALKKKKIIGRKSNGENDQPVSGIQNILINEIEIENNNIEANCDNQGPIQQANTNINVPLIDNCFNFDLNISFSNI